MFLFSAYFTRYVKFAGQPTFNDIFLYEKNMDFDLYLCIYSIISVQSANDFWQVFSFTDFQIREVFCITLNSHHLL